MKDYLFTDTECSIIMKALLEGVDYLHSNNIVHRDLKPENIMLSDINDFSSVKIIDLGLSTFYDSILHSQCGTVIYMAPEMNSKLPIYDNLVDVWALGIILYILLSGGRHPLVNPIEFDPNIYITKLKEFKEWKFPDTFPL